ncbi:unnamed protein product [Lactuca saligna]|uniref:Uncharacterized protein n=1 Tax=Lactuca saligna TaxID=75948 RepID=A0AA35YSY4_LACSI|nr:unnamed protein product [Lactuca saligna]
MKGQKPINETRPKYGLIFQIGPMMSGGNKEVVGNGKNSSYLRTYKHSTTCKAAETPPTATTGVFPHVTSTGKTKERRSFTYRELLVACDSRIDAHNAFLGPWRFSWQLTTVTASPLTSSATGATVVVFDGHATRR